ncbi:unnamed protein product [Allacma fusca]|uniref:SNF-related serine/threonine-protein kinase n=1 Tax=Allacma fusca TaxID=39272 RepID=A0A8J2JY46_9HEXA|nr:unnamed protein product [Allacma fusca]
MAGLYDLEETLGKGHFAVVKAAKHVFTGERVAVKVIDKTKLDAISQKGLLKEVLCMKLVQHPNVVRLYEVIDTTTKMYLVLELGQGDLYDLILKHQGGLNEDLARKYFSQILAAVSYCHKLHVCHRDLKPENVVFFPVDCQVKLTDFGFSNRFCPGVKLDTSCGSLAYSAPEILLGDAYDAPAVDIWSLGVILYMLVCGRAPFQEANDSETLTMIMDVKYSIPPHVSSPCRDLISRMLVRYPEKRATLAEIEKDPWIIQGGHLPSQVQNPLISAHRLTPEERNSIVQQMVVGEITTREQILEALQRNAYNHVTSTFYLLAEKLLRERGNNEGGDDKPGTSSALTASLESLHDRRKSSDTEDLASGEDDSLAPLDLEIKGSSASGSQSSKKTSRMHTVLSSSALSELDKSLPILEEDIIGHCEEVEDSAGPLPQAVGNVIRRTHYNHRRVMVPQRSASCSSSEDEDSEKKKRSLPPHRHKNKGARGHNSGEEITRRFRDDESSDEQSGGCAGGFSGNAAPHSLVSMGQNSSNGSGGSRSYNPPGAQGGGDSQSDASSAKDAEGNQCNNNSQHDKHHRVYEDGSRSITTSLSFFERESDLSPQLSNLTLRKLPPSISAGCVGNVDITERHSCTNMAYSVKNVVSGTVSDPVSGRSVAKKSKKLFFSWFFIKRKKNINNTIPASSGIYKTRSCAELKSKNGMNRKHMDVNQNV